MINQTINDNNNEVPPKRSLRRRGSVPATIVRQHHWASTPSSSPFATSSKKKRAVLKWGLLVWKGSHNHDRDPTFFALTVSYLWIFRGQFDPLIDLATILDVELNTERRPPHDKHEGHEKAMVWIYFVEDLPNNHISIHYC